MTAFCATVILALGVSEIFASLYHLQMLQQNGYYLSRYVRWLKKSFSPAICLPVIVAAAWIAGCFLPRPATLSMLAAVAALSLLRIPKAVSTQKKAVKKLVFTPRVKRLLCGEAFVYLCLIAPILAASAKAAFVAAGAVSFFPPLTVSVSWVFLYPVERCITDRYIHDAKRRLREMPKLTVIGVTGSYGKTGTKNILGRILSEKYNTLVTPESYNTPMGVVKTIRERLTPETQVFVCEMGARKPGDIESLCKIADPDIGIITSVGPQHLETFGTVEAVLAAKLELADYVLAKKGRVYVNGDNEYLKASAKRSGILTYGTDEGCDCRVISAVSAKDGVSLTLRKNGSDLRLASRLLGAHNALNLAGAAAVSLDMHIPESAVKYAVSTLKPTPHRLEPKPYIAGSLLIDDSYNSNPEGAEAAMRVLGEFKNMRKIAVTPGMVELGREEYAYNRRLGTQAAAACDILILVGEGRAVPLREGALAAGFNESALYVVPAFKQAAELLKTLCDANTVVLFENDLPDVYT